MNIQLVMFKENGERKDFPISNQTTVVGREESCDIRIPLAEVSRQHAEFKLSRQGVSLRDLGSSNGTFVNNKRVKQKDLAAGDHVVIGPVVFTVQIDGDPRDIRPIKTKLQKLSNFSPEDDLAPETDAQTRPLVPADQVDPEGSDAAMQALSAIPEGSSIAFELDEDIDLSDSDIDKD